MQVTQINKIDKKLENNLNENNIFECPHCHEKSDLSEIINNVASIKKDKLLLDAKKDWANNEKPKLEKKYKIDHHETLKDIKNEFERSRENEIYQQAKEKYKTGKEEDQSKIKGLEENLKKYSGDRKNLNKIAIELNDLKRSKEEDEDKIKLEKDIEWQEKLDKANEQHKIDKEKDELKFTKLKEEAERIASQGPIQVQGEAMEITLEKWLKKTFPEDQITEVEKGKNGADIIQKVKNGLGTICIESKNTKAFSKKWITKLKKDMKKISANKGIIVTNTLPSDLPKGGYRSKDRIWIYDIIGFKKIIYLLRQFIIDEYQLIQSNSNSKEKSSLVYRYINSDDYKNEISTQIDSWIDESSDLDKEVTSTNARWAKRTARLNDIKKSMANIYGHFKHIMGPSIPNVEIFELPQKKLITKKKKRSK